MYTFLEITMEIVTTVMTKSFNTLIGRGQYSGPAVFVTTILWTLYI